MRIQKAVLFAAILLFPSVVPAFRIDQKSPKGIILTLSRIYRSADHQRLLSICNPRGKRYYRRIFRGYGLTRWKSRVRNIGRRIINVSLVSISIRRDGAVRLGYIFDLRKGRRTVPYKEWITLVKKDGLYWIRGKY